MVLVWHTIKQDQVTKGSSNIVDRSPSRVATVLQSLEAMGTVVVKI